MFREAESAKPTAVISVVVVEFVTRWSRRTAD